MVGEPEGPAAAACQNRYLTTLRDGIRERTRLHRDYRNAPLGSCGASRYLTDATAASPPSRGDDKCVLADYNMRSSPKPTDLVMLSSTIVRRPLPYRYRYVPG